MELSWSTFVLEIINFLVLVWILKRFLYKPVLGVIERRRQGIQETLDRAEALRDETDSLKSQYEHRLADWEAERELARETLLGEIEKERRRRMEWLEAELREERERAQVVAERGREEAVRKIEQQALQQAAGFASRLLSSLACPEVERRLVDLVVDELDHLSGDRLSAMKETLRNPPEEVIVTSGFVLPDDRRQRLEMALTAVTGASVPFRYEQSEELLAGLRVVIGAWVIGANLKDELSAFVEFAHDKT